VEYRKYTTVSAYRVPGKFLNLPQVKKMGGAEASAPPMLIPPVGKEQKLIQAGSQKLSYTTKPRLAGLLFPAFERRSESQVAATQRCYCKTGATLLGSARNS
jgi:hypothetical protein